MLSHQHWILVPYENILKLVVYDYLPTILWDKVLQRKMLTLTVPVLSHQHWILVLYENILKLVVYDSISKYLPNIYMGQSFPKKNPHLNSSSVITPTLDISSIGKAQEWHTSAHQYRYKQ